MSVLSEKETVYLPKTAEAKKTHDELRMDEPLPPEYWPDFEQLITEDDTPLDNIFSERQQRLLVDSLYSSWRDRGQKRPFIALANVGLFYSMYDPPLVPDLLLSLDVQFPDNVFLKRHRSYFTWIYGKPPEVVIEVVSNDKGEEAGSKMHIYARRIGVVNYIIYDPENHLKGDTVRAFELRGGTYYPVSMQWLPLVQLGLTLKEGKYEDLKGTWLRWCDKDGHILSTGQERTAEERKKAKKAEMKAQEECKKAERLMEKLRMLGVDPEENK